MRRRFFFGLAGAVAFGMIVWLLNVWLQKERLFALMPCGASLAIWFGERKGYVPTADEANRPLSILP